ncbi:chromosome segregation protein SMC [Cellulomonas flavigena DSM 20109]|uniref:Chromosome partition protein Smc n=1 Tax=Cellulomonas flavigena (strain ATCC 482 / DSM 20109 / BCRC 11376 / JCM 18109 / NBRC 3775 / NCIMB 8073 / NRS 134) TaxID=446466 RepID=D5UD23_CELFN|nr:chromosome segregation protein SMC [Cellulomonas flavigena]ADG74360.1 chromosome segregation protein SMC [Cellulomonas flavigena DSM 20109]
MHLKTLTLRGFKSFASATTLSFEPGITCVVGPNGSGKSNVVDALAWVMGEQGAKSLRGGKMEDVIFAGTSGRPPLGRAEVSLTIDNTDGALPIEYSEVTISRTLFRNGGSEYAINGRACRLLDIQDLLSDSGLGREMHVIVGQGQLDAVLRATPEERRGFIEEAAGVLKHRKRKEKALRKLDAMQGNLTRLGDLTAEIRRQLGPLGRQAEVARKAAVVQADLRDSRARLLADDLAQLRARLEQEIADESAVRERRELVEGELAEARARLGALEREAAEAAPAVSEAGEVWYRLSSLRERVRGTASLAADRARLLGTASAERTGGQDPADLEAQAERVRRAEAELAAEVDLARTAVAAAGAARQEAETAAAAAERALADLQRAAADRREGVARLAGQVAARRSRVEATEAEIGRLRESLAAAEERAREATTRFAALETQVAGVEEGEEGLDAEHEAAAEALDAATERVASLEEELRAAERERDQQTSRAETLELSLDRKDGAGALLAADGLPGVVGSVAALLSVDARDEEAIVAALGAVADAVAVESVDAAVDAIRHLRTEDAGRATLMVAGAGEVAVADLPSGVERAVDLVQAPAAVRDAVRALLADVVVVDDLAAARPLVASHPHLVVATRAGDVLSRFRASGGSASAPSALHLQGALDAARAAAATATAAAERLRFDLTAARDARAAAQAEVDATLDRLNESDAALAAVAEQLGHLGSAARAARAEAERVQRSLDAAGTTLAEDHTTLAELTARLAAVEVAPEDSEASIAQATGRRDATAAEATAARGRETEARLTLRTGEERARALAGRAESLERAAASERAAREKAARRQEERARQAAVALAVHTAAVHTGGLLDRALRRASDARDAAEAARAERDAALAAVRTRVDGLARDLAELTDVAHKDEVARAEQRLRIEQLETRAVEELGLDPQVLLDEFGPHRDVPVVPVPGAEPDEDAPTAVPYVRAEQEKRLRAAERALALLGKVNPLALEEFAALEERHQFLVEQLADLKKSRADLLEIVKDIDERVERVFSDAYRDTAAAFDDVFPRLFPGGEGRLVLTDPDDMLTTGIEVEARPAGKKVKRLSLLSGGERSLTAVALLVAIFKARPSPFYVMDEVEAALDDANLGRLLGIFRELQEDSQLIVVTHQKRTMEIADALYGVTMRGDGVTTVISQRMAEDVPA